MKIFSLQISPPCIEFVLPSPPVGIPFLQPVDPPWMPKMKAKVEEVTINQKEVAVSELKTFYLVLKISSNRIYIIKKCPESSRHCQQIAQETSTRNTAACYRSRRAE